MPLVVLVVRTASDRVGVLAAADGHDERAPGQFRERRHGEITVTGARLTGTVDLIHAQVSAGVDLSDTVISAGNLDADNIVVTGDLELANATIEGCTLVQGARVEGTFSVEGTHLGADDGVSLRAAGLTTFQLALECHTPPGDLDLRYANVDVLSDLPDAWPHGPGRPLTTDFTYRQLRVDLPVHQRLEILRRSGIAVQPQPYELLASVYRAAGRDRDARRVLREKLRRESRAAGWPQRIWGHLQDLTIGYGYCPGRAAAIFTALLVAGITYFAKAPHCAGHPGLCPIDPTKHPTWDPFLYTLDTLIPIIDLGQQKAWDPTGLDKTVTTVMMLAGWIFATTLIAAASRALSRA